ADPLEEHDELQREENDRIDGRAPACRVEGLHELPHACQIERPLEAAVQVVSRHQRVARETGERGKDALFVTHHPSWDYLLLRQRTVKRHPGTSRRLAPAVSGEWPPESKIPVRLLERVGEP